MGTLNSSGNNFSSVSEQLVPPWEALNRGLTLWVDFSPIDQERIVRHFSPKVKYLALRLKNRLPQNIELGELISSGTLGLIESFTKFNAALGVKFETYAESRIKGAMLDELRRLDWFPRSLRSKVRTLNNAISKLENLYGKRPSEEMLAEETGISVEEVREGLEAIENQFCLSFDVFEESVTSISCPRTEEPQAQVAMQELLEKMADLIEQLTPREKLVLSLYYTDELNMRETAHVMGISEGRVSQLHSQALVRLRKIFIHHHGEINLSL